MLINLLKANIQVKGNPISVNGFSSLEELCSVTTQH